MRSLRVLLLAGTLMLSACGGGNSNGGSLPPITLSGNWQFSMTDQIDPSNPNNPAKFLGGLQGGFLLENSGSVTGAVAYAVSSSTSTTGPCSGGPATIAGTIKDRTLTLTATNATAGAQTFTLTGQLSFDGTTMFGSYSSTAGTASDGSACGYAETGQSWNATLVPPITGSVQGGFHSTGGVAGLSNQIFPVTGFLTQSDNTGASTATITGSLSFVTPTSNSSDYPCLDTASVTGTISGNTVILDLNKDGSKVGQIGVAATQANLDANHFQPVTFDSTSNGFVLHSLLGTAYAVTTKACSGDNPPGDEGNICLAVGSTTACQQPITLTPAVLTFPPQSVGTTSTAKTIWVANTSGSTLSGVALIFPPVPNFTETDACGADGGPSNGGSFLLLPGQSCAVAVTFSPQTSGALTTTLTVTSPASPDNNTAFSVPITGTGVDASATASAPRLDFGAEDVSQVSLLEWLSFTGHSGHPTRTLPTSINRTSQDEEHHAEMD